MFNGKSSCHQHSLNIICLGLFRWTLQVMQKLLFTDVVGQQDKEIKVGRSSTKRLINCFLFQELLCCSLGPVKKPT